MSRYLGDKFENFLATDLDGTLVGNDQDCAKLNNYLRNNYKNIGLAYITGRHFESACQLIKEKLLEPPDFLVTDVGTVIHFYKIGVKDEIWQNRMTIDWQPAEIRKIGTAIKGLKEQKLPDDCRVSYTADSESSAARLQSALSDARLPHTYVFSSNQDVDILPAGGGKGEVLKYLISSYVKPGARILAAGDSGNDKEMLTSGYPSVIVANAQAELLAIPDDVKIFRATRKYAGGILEGWQHFYN